MPFNYRAIIRALGFIIGINGVAMLPSLLCGYYYHENQAAIALGMCGVASFIAGLMMFHFSRLKAGSPQRPGRIPDCFR